MLTLRTERLILRDYRPADLADHHRLMSDEKTMYFLPDLLTHSLAESRQNLEEAMAAALEAPREKVFLAMELAEGGAYLGSVGYTVIDSPPPGKVVHAGYFMLPEHHGKGYMPEAVLELMRHAFEDDGVFRFETGCFADNRPSERVMQKCGMVREAHHRQCAWHDGKMRDRLLYSLLRDEWAARKT
ncbi:GNAT family N-acetyltransferase [Ruminococcaceae bacterium OttesenSCG-928-D13]|nr:GNAT family N-acetyltransferase [Ruminococcaceae bacterium OttesenSCG-928-D13]